MGVTPHLDQPPQEPHNYGQFHVTQHHPRPNGGQVKASHNRAADPSTSEPISLPWSTRQLTELARGRAPHPTLLTATGTPDRPALATLSLPITSSTLVRADTPDHRVAASAGMARGSGGAAMTSA
ncbi:DUF6177 family protein [Streptomyces sp. NBC_00006]|uniref:DUF6177 family protein n=1 Tax=Streptomyces sp. NBC_00006 TaxID=2975619 RepID=UPI002B1CEDD7|nr:DUF6177 family protein [Streptomyces sp. NBC_00006]